MSIKIKIALFDPKKAENFMNKITSSRIEMDHFSFPTAKKAIV